eukprot:4878244-Pleurochrysis_carterae.AAC.1
MDDGAPGLPPAELPHHATTSESALRPSPEHESQAHASRTVLLLFSGPMNRPDGIAAFLAQSGFTA